MELWHSGLNGPQIANTLGTSSSNVYRLLKSSGIRPAQANRAHERPGNRSNAPEDEREIVRRYQAGETMAALGRAFNCHLATIRNVLVRHGVTPRGPGGPMRQVTREEAEVILRRWNDGEAQGTIAKSLGMSQSQVSRLLSLHGLASEKRISRRETHGNWKGGRSTNRHGYVFVRIDADDPMASMRNTGGYVQEHRLVTARHLSRPLHPWETVHHIDGRRDNNDISNLQLRVGNHGKGVVMVCGDCGSTNVVERRVASVT